MFDLRTLATAPWAALSGEEEIPPQKLLGLAIITGVVEAAAIAAIVIALAYQPHWYTQFWLVGVPVFLYGELLWVRYFREDPYPYNF